MNHTNVGLAIERLLRRWTGVWHGQGVGCATRRDWPCPVASGTMAPMPDQRRISDSGGTSWRGVDQACLESERWGRQRASTRGPVRPISIVRCQVPASHPRLPDQCEGMGRRKKDERDRTNSVRGSDAAESIHEMGLTSHLTSCWSWC